MDKLGQIDFKFIFILQTLREHSTKHGNNTCTTNLIFSFIKKKMMRDCIQYNEEQTCKQSAKNHKQKSELIKGTNMMFSFYLFLDLREVISLEL